MKECSNNQKYIHGKNQVGSEIKTAIGLRHIVFALVAVASKSERVRPGIDATSPVLKKSISRLITLCFQTRLWGAYADFYCDSALMWRLQMRWQFEYVLFVF